MKKIGKILIVILGIIVTGYVVLSLFLKDVFKEILDLI